MKNVLFIMVIALMAMADKKMIIRNNLDGMPTYGILVADIDSIVFSDVPCGLTFINSKNKSFIMGSSFNCWSDEVPAHEVTFTHNFFISTTEVTQKDYDDIMSSAYMGFYVKPNWTDSLGLGDNYPAYNLNWFDAILYCNARSIAEKKEPVYSHGGSSGGSFGSGSSGLSNLTWDFSKDGYRLPTEAEWEFCCRANTTTKFYWGEAVDTVVNYAWVMVSMSGMSSHPVAEKLPNNFGLYDMIGNLFEWCHDYYSETYAGAASVDPTGIESPAYGLYRSIRGGSWYSGNQKPPTYSCSVRNKLSPSTFVVGESYSLLMNVGFRVICH